MKIYINTASRETLQLVVNGNTYEINAGSNKSVQLLPFLKEKLIENGKQISDISEVEVTTGPGSFTGLRIGVSVAQTLGWSLHVPVNGQNFNQTNFIEIKY